MENFKSDPDFQPLAIAFKRVVNIIRNAENGKLAPDTSCTEERKLHEAFLAIREIVHAPLGRGGLSVPLSSPWRGLRKPVDAFFETGPRHG